jgi:hypothetical protein
MVWTYRIQYCLPFNIILLITIDQFDLNPILVNINKLKPCRYVSDNVLNLVLVQPSDLEPLEKKNVD